jgi:hypothetical protein
MAYGPHRVLMIATDKVTSRSEAGAAAFCRIRGVLSTLANRGIALLAAPLKVFADGSLPSIAAT